MTTKQELETREADCSSAADFAALAKEAVGLDADYVKALLEKAEMQCQMPPDYIAAAEGAMAAGLTDYAKDLYEQCEDACFEFMELAALGASLARTGQDAAKGREMLENAAGDASKLNEFLTISGYAKEALGDEELAASLLAKVEEKANTLDDYVNLAKTLKGEGADEAASSFYAKAARYCEDMEQTVAYARGMIDILEDKDGARKTLEDAETDCQFPKDFASLAGGFKDMFDDGDKVAELMEQAADFAMSGEENLDLAKGYWSLMGDKDKAVDAFGKALPDVNDKAQLLELAAFIAAQVSAPDLAKQFYAKAESKMSAAPERLKLAEAVIGDTGDMGYALEIYSRASESLNQPNDLMSVAAEVVDRLGDKAKSGEIYRKAFDAMSNLGQYTKLLEAVDGKLADKDFGRDILTRAGQVASGTPHFLDLSKRTMQVLADKDVARGFLDKAEEQVTTVGEMKNLVAAVKDDFADDSAWVTQVEEKLARREANQSQYAVFQDREKKATTSIKLLQLTDAVMDELDDKFYARKLLVDAQKKLDDEGWDFSKARKLIQGVSVHLGDAQWAAKLLEDAAARVNGFSDLVTVAESASELLPDKGASKALVGGMLAVWEKQLESATDKSAYDFSKLASVKGRLLGDRDAAAADLDKAVEQGGDHFTFAELARVAGGQGLDDRVQGLLDKAAGACSGAGQATQLAKRLLESGFGPDRVRALYTGLKSSMAGGSDKLRWVDGIVDLFGDRAWAGREYDALAQSAQGDALNLVQQNRRRRA